MRIPLRVAQRTYYLEISGVALLSLYMALGLPVCCFLINLYKFVLFTDLLDYTLDVTI